MSVVEERETPDYGFINTSTNAGTAGKP